MNAIPRIPDTPAKLLWMATQLDRLRDEVERGGQSWPTLEEECAMREQEP